MSKHLNIKPCVLSQFLTLLLWICIPFQVVLFSSFRADEKKQKARHRVSKFAPSSCSYLCIDNTALSHPVRCKLRLHYARLYAGGIVDLQSKFVRFSLVVIILTCQIREWGNSLSTHIHHRDKHRSNTPHSIPDLTLIITVSQTVPSFRGLLLLVENRG